MCLLHIIDEKRTEIYYENMKGKGHLQHVSIDGRTVVKWGLKKQGMRVWRRFYLAQDWAQ
jgi:hypothetical protein